jgi:RNA polymerase sigma factor (TIGR02999 family)
MDPGGEVTQLLEAMHDGVPGAAERLLPLVYAELHRLAKAYMRGERPDHTLQPTALINEAYLRLLGDPTDWKSRGHFIAIAANAMRRVLVDYARARNAERRGHGAQRVELRDDLALSPERIEEIVFLDDLMTRLALSNPRQARVVELRYFGGLAIEQIADLLDIAPSTVKRDWALARIWLARELQPAATPPDPPDPDPPDPDPPDPDPPDPDKK